MSNIPTGTTLNGHSITYWNRQTEADGDAMSTDTIMPICSAINDNIKAIETMQAATDVIDVFGSYSAFEENSGTLTAEGYLTDKDIIKVLEDETNDTQQTYYQYSSADKSWTFIGSLDPYYSKSDIDEITANIETEISTNYLKADNINEGNNITITKTTMTDGPTITIGTKDDVSFNKVSSTGFSGTNISGGSKTATIDNLITSAEGGSAANSWLTTNISNYISAIGSADMKNITGEISTGTNGSAKTATIKLSGYKTIINTSTYLTGNETDTYTSAFGLTNNAVTYITEGHEASAWITNNSDKYVRHDDTSLIIGNTGNLAVTGTATALGYQASAKNNSFAICLGNSDTVLENRSFAVGFGNSGNNGSYIIGEGNDTTSTQSTHHFTIGINNKNTGENSYIIGSNNATNTDGLIILGHKASTTHIPSDILAVGNGNGGDCLLINPTAFKFKPGTTEIHLNEYGLYNNNTEKLYSWYEVLGLGTAVERGGTELTTSCSSTDQLLANNILIYGDVNDDTYAFYVSSATQTLTNYSHTFRLYTTVMSKYKLKISVPDTYDILLKCFSDNGWGFTPTPGGTTSTTNIMHKKGSIKNSYKTSDGLPYANTYTTGNPLSLWYPHDNAGSAHYFYFQQLWGGQYIDVTVDSQTHTFIMRKGGGDV